MELQNLNKIIHSNLLSSNIIKANINTSLLIKEIKNLGKANTLQSVKISNLPIKNCWIFEHEDGEKEFLASGKNVEKTLLYLDDNVKKLFIIPIELKTDFRIKHLNECSEKLNPSLTHISIFLATNNHLIDKYNDYKINFRLAIFCVSETISNQHPEYNTPLCQEFVLFQNGTKKRFNIDITSPSLGFIKVPSIRVLEETENIEIDFQDLLSRLT